MSCSNRYGAAVPVDPCCPKIQEIAAWAVAVYNKQHGACLRLVRVSKAAQQVVSGTNYYLDLEVANGCQVNKYLAKVYNQPWTCTRNLLEFRLVCQNNALNNDVSSSHLIDFNANAFDLFNFSVKLF